ncbi:MAG: hypothetical protein K2N81_04120, partial [Acetatifactor sp.]|nr:hypothetical protein [Acetatifactor sp.]
SRSSTWISDRFYNKDLSATTFNGISVSASINYSAAYASYRNAAAANKNDGHNFNAADDAFLEPANANGNLIQKTGSNLISFPAATTDTDARTSQETWAFSFYMNGIGKVTTDTPGISYYAPSDREADDEHTWWHWSWYEENGKKHYYQSTSLISSNENGQGTLASVMDTLTGAKGTRTPGLLTKKDNPAAGNSGDCRHGGYIDLDFSLKAEILYTYADNRTTDSVGSFTIRVSVAPSDTEQSVLDKITAALNKDTLLDFYTASATEDRNYLYKASARRHAIDVPVYGGICNFYVQAGTEAGQHIEINYDSLGVIALGLQDTNTLTQESSRAAIEDVKSAMKIINKQRSDFGAYQNRLEHAYQVNKNSEENTQASESVIRDTDMAKTMVEYANSNILLQAGTSLLAQSNQRANDVLYLLR